jgi:hypothetical protein
MDSWSGEQIEKMRMGGNQQCSDFLSHYGGMTITTTSSDNTIKKRYDSAPALLYQQVLQARREGQPEPTELPPRKESTNTQRREMTGFGSPQQPSSSSQRKLQLRLQPVPVAIEKAFSSIWNMAKKRYDR